MLDEQAGALSEAMATDLGKPAVEGWLTDVAAIGLDVAGILRHLDRWTEPRRVGVPLTLQPGTAQVRPEPLGAVLVIGPWNYPVRCLVLPLAFALAAGNAAAVKPSELAPATSAALARMIPEYLDPAAVSVVEGGPEVAAELLAQRWDHIFFTGGARVGRLVLQAAAPHLTPVTLELGGKNPVIVDRGANIAVAARRIAWGKFLNAGQTCVAPDYALVAREVRQDFVTALGRAVERFYGADPQSSPDFARIVNDTHVRRLETLLRTPGRGQIVIGGQVERALRYVAPTVIVGTEDNDPVMEEEIFGPILPIIDIESLDEALGIVNGRDKPLALYVYSDDRAVAERVISETSSGGVCINHNAVQLAVPGLPFGGVGASGMGAYHGRYGFDTFSHAKAVLRRPSWGEVALMYPPYSRAKELVVRRFLRILTSSTLR
jgi:aldehyde dehydrogenase (NAD+)